MPCGRGNVGPIEIGWTDASPHARFAAGRRLMSELAADVTGATNIEIFRRCARCGADDHGAPHVRGVQVAVSVSYAGTMVAAAAVRMSDAAAVGIDIEADTAQSRVEELALLFGPQGVPDLRRWTLLEAALKADGRGMNVDPSTVRMDTVPRTVLGDGVAVRIPGSSDSVVAAAARGPAGFVLSVAVRRPLTGSSTDRKTP